MMQMAGHESGLSAMIQVKFVGIVACIARKQGNPASNSIIGNWMMTQIEGMISLGIRMDLIAEHLDAFFDIYADAAFDYNQVFIENQFLERLRAIESAVKVGTKKVDKRTNKDTRIHCDQVALNLPAFIAYKAQE